jgi:acyl-coenzyme A thioesterase PaaI-like protein
VAIEIPTPAAVNEFFAREFPSAHAVGHRCVETGEGVAVARWPYDPTQLRPGSLISGPTQFAIADLAFWFMTFTVVGLAPMAVTSELYIQFLRRPWAATSWRAPSCCAPASRRSPAWSGSGSTARRSGRCPT